MKKIISLTIAALFVFSALAVFVSLSDTDMNVDAELPSEYWMDQITNDDKMWYDDDPTAITLTVTTARELAYLSVLVNGGDDNFNGKTILFQPAGGTLSLSDHLWTPIGWDDDEGVTIFQGEFDGQNNTIDGMIVVDNYLGYNDPNDPYNTYALGLFGVIVSNAAVKNLKMTDPYVDGEYGVGAVVGYMISGAVTNCSVTDGTITGDNNVGGVAGYSGGTVTDCYNIGAISGYDLVGGIVGYNNHGTVTNCYNTGDVSGNNNVGGITGYNNNNGMVENCYNTGDVSGNDRVGGITSNNNSNVTNCYNTGSVSGNDYVGGIASNGGNVTNCYNTGDVSGNDRVGGIIGAGSITTDCYNTGEVDGKDYVGGIVGRIQNDGTVTDCYNTGVVSGDDYVEPIVGNGTFTADTCYWLNTPDFPNGLTIEEMTGSTAFEEMSSLTSTNWVTKANAGANVMYLPQLKVFATSTDSTISEDSLKSVTIDTRTPTVISQTDDYVFTKGQKLSAITNIGENLTVSPSDVNGTYAWAEPNKVLSITDTTAKVIFTPTDSITYSPSEKVVNIVVNEPVPNDSDGGNNTMIIVAVIAVVAIGGLGAAYFLLIRKS